jgi:non-ribosomal peptide synthetase component F
VRCHDFIILVGIFVIFHEKTLLSDMRYPSLVGGRCSGSCGAIAVYPYDPGAARRTLLDVFESTVRAHAGALALADDSVSLSYRDLFDEVSALAARLGAAGIGVGDRVGILVRSETADLYVAILAVLAAGAAYVPADADDPLDWTDLIWNEAGVCAVLSDGRCLTPRPQVSPRGERRAPVPEDDAWIIFTSGSTGRPKGVAVTHRSAAAFVDAESRLFCQNRPLGPGDRVLAGLSVAFDASCEEMWLAWRHGAALIPVHRFLVRAGAELGPWLVEREITVISTVPALAALWPEWALASVRLLILGGETCSPELIARVDDGVREVWNTYGPTEATVVACGARVRKGDQVVRIGLPLAGWRLAVVGPDGRSARWGETGELIIGGVGLARYLDSELDATRFQVGGHRRRDALRSAGVRRGRRGAYRTSRYPDFGGLRRASRGCGL